MIKNKNEIYNIKKTQIDIFKKENQERLSNKSKKPTVIDRKNMDIDRKNGENAFDSGIIIPDDILQQKPFYFIQGYEIARRRHLAISLEKERGKEFFMAGGLLEECDLTKTNPYFIEGYNDAMKEVSDVYEEGRKRNKK